MILYLRPPHHIQLVGDVDETSLFDLTVSGIQPVLEAMALEVGTVPERSLYEV